MSKHTCIYMHMYSFILTSMVYFYVYAPCVCFSSFVCVLSYVFCVYYKGVLWLVHIVFQNFLLCKLMAYIPLANPIDQQDVVLENGMHNFL